VQQQKVSLPAKIIILKIAHSKIYIFVQKYININNTLFSETDKLHPQKCRRLDQ
jgi:hypothetical protein